MNIVIQGAFFISPILVQNADFCNNKKLPFLLAILLYSAYLLNYEESQTASYDPDQNDCVSKAS